MKHTNEHKKIAGVVLVGIFFLVLVSAGRTIDDATNISITNFTAGSTTQANFSYSYIRDKIQNPDYSPLILKISVNSSDQENFPVWKGDFEIDGYIQRANLFWIIVRPPIPFTCSEEITKVSHPIGEVTIELQNGTFYCFDANGELDFEDFNTKDTIFLNIKSHPALWPGQYNLTAELYYLTDTYPPVVKILNKENFENVYYRSGNDIKVKVNITDVNLNTDEIRGKIYWNGNETFLGKNKEDGLYYFSKTIPDEVPEGNHTIEIFAIDTEGNNATDETRLLIDETPPTINLISPKGGERYGGNNTIMTIKANITDEKSKVNKDEVYYRLREMNGTSVCPDTGVGTWECYNSGWMNLPFNETSKLFGKEVNTTEINLTSGEYWLDIKAEDNLGNLAYLE